MTPLRPILLILSLWALAFAGSASAQTQKSILVLDASGSMWGQIEGEAKITIAKRVIGGLLQNIPEDQALGLSAYGHNRKGDCGDIELLVPPATGNRAAILSAVEAISPKGKTPLSAAVIAAAGDLRYTEDRATVILISDGIETCDLDPCAVGSELEASGVDFTAHVIGFDVATQEDREQLACLAENTGGEFLAASNASELELALEQVAEPAPPPPPPAPEKVDLIIEVTDGEGGPVIQNGLVWTLIPTTADGTNLKDFELGVLRMKVLPGTYAVEAAWPAEANLAVAAIDVLPDQQNRFTLVMKSNLPPASVDAVSEAVAGTYVMVDWTGPNRDLDYVAIAATDQEAGRSINLTRVKDGSPVRIQMPATPGDYELRYVLYSGPDILATKPIRVVEGDVAVEAAAEAVAGTYLPVTWRGPDSELDYIAIAEIGAGGGATLDLARTRDGNPVNLQMPATPGTYELRYVLYNGRAILATRPILVTEVAASVSGPAEAEAGTYVAVEWEGPDSNLDYVAIASPDMEGGVTINRQRTKDGSPVQLQMPSEPGTYELRYVLYNERAILATQPIEVTEVVVSVSGPAEAEAGTYIDVTWEGPGADLDYVAIAAPGTDGGDTLDLARTKDGATLQLQMPATPGTYELRYVLYSERAILATQPIEVTEVAVSVSGPAEAEAGTYIAVEWEGPDANLDYVAIAAPDAPPQTVINQARTKDGSPLRLQMPAEAGDYELRYVLYNDRVTLATQPIRATPANVAVSAPSTASGGSSVVVEWTGPNADLDFIDVAEVGSNKSINSIRTKEGSPLVLQMPPEPGTYEIRYVLYNKRVPLAATPIDVTPPVVSLSVPSEAGAGETIAVEWEGPDANLDYIAISAIGSKDGQQLAQTRTNKGSPLTIKMPDVPGIYEIRYVLYNKRVTLERTRITVK